MPVTASADAARVNRRRGAAADGVTFWHSLYIGTTRYNMAPGTPDPDPAALFPMAFLVEQDPGSTANAHYHQQDQFQLVVHGGGTLGLHEIGPITVHFTASRTAYGPIRADDEHGVWYFTLRNGFDPGARFMAVPEKPLSMTGAILDGPETERLLGPEPDGMGAWRFRLRPGQRLIAPDPAWGRGQYWVVVGGAMLRESEALPRLSCVFVYPDEGPLVAAAGPDGLDVVAMQFPRSAGG
jgi:hypothetical protein